MVQFRPVLALIAILVLAFIGPARAETSPSLFGTNEIRSPNLASFTNWTGVMNRFEHARELGDGLCASAGPERSACAWDDWQNIIADAAMLDGVAQLRKVNAVMNDKRYTLDRVNWGAEDYWATVFEFLRKNGDCEDYAIAKYVTLRALGWPASKLRVVIVRDTKLNLNHAIVAIYTDEGIYIGDNQVDGLVKASSIRHYRAIYSINEEGWWLHRPPRR
jgi:predicted transglutaminase-like cysteine proteinase